MISAIFHNTERHASSIFASQIGFILISQYIFKPRYRGLSKNDKLIQDNLLMVVNVD